MGVMRREILGTVLGDDGSFLGLVIASTFDDQEDDDDDDEDHGDDGDGDDEISVHLSMSVPLIFLVVTHAVDDVFGDRIGIVPGGRIVIGLGLEKKQEMGI